MNSGQAFCWNPPSCFIVNNTVALTDLFRYISSIKKHNQSDLLGHCCWCVCKCVVSSLLGLLFFSQLKHTTVYCAFFFSSGKSYFVFPLFFLYLLDKAEIHVLLQYLQRVKSIPVSTSTPHTPTNDFSGYIINTHLELIFAVSELCWQNVIVSRGI